MYDDETLAHLHHLARLYLAVAQTTDGDFSNVELDAVTERLHVHFAKLDRAEVQNVVLEEFAEHTDPNTLNEVAQQAIGVLGEALDAKARSRILSDLAGVARADGVVLESERSLLAEVAAAWEVQRPKEANRPVPRPSQSLGSHLDALHHLAYIYLVLAHGTDRELSDDERELILRKLEHWKQRIESWQVETVLEHALDDYAQGTSPKQVAEAAHAVRKALPPNLLKAALDDLVQIANADGVFLDSEEDLINELRTAWNLDAYAGYE